MLLIALPLDAFAAGMGDDRITTTLCPGGNERMRRSGLLICIRW
jgi:alcohol dehydrogenase